MSRVRGRVPDRERDGAAFGRAALAPMLRLDMQEPSAEDARFAAALAAIDAANQGDPHQIEVRGRRGPKEQLHAELVTGWLQRLRPDAPEALLLAGRAHHVRRWEIPRGRFPQGRAGYLRWRRALQQLHADVTAAILREVGYGEEIVARVADLLHKRGLGRDPDAQAFEDALCLVFLETQLADFHREHAPEKAGSVLVKTLRKMSPEARRLARELPLEGAARDALAEALASAGG